MTGLPTATLRPVDPDPAGPSQRVSGADRDGEWEFAPRPGALQGGEAAWVVNVGLALQPVGAAVSGSEVAAAAGCSRQQLYQ